MKRNWSIFLIPIGLLILLFGVSYDIMFAGIPYQDPTPEMTANYRFHANIASAIRWFGTIVFFAGIVISVPTTLIRLFRSVKS